MVLQSCLTSVEEQYVRGGGHVGVGQWLDSGNQFTAPLRWRAWVGYLCRAHTPTVRTVQLSSPYTRDAII